MQYTNGLSEYEILRLQNIQRNNEKLKKLGLKETKVEMQKQIKQQTRKRKQSTIKRKKEIKAKAIKICALNKDTKMHNIERINALSGIFLPFMYVGVLIIG